MPARRASGTRRDERGIALISVIAVLVLLAMVATPFLLTMRDSSARGEKFLYVVKADAEAAALFDTVRSHLVGNLEHVERRRLDGLGLASTDGSLPPADATPTSDGPSELVLPGDVLARFNRSTAKDHRVWAADIVDTQTVFNLNTCSYPILANILGRTEVAGPVPKDKTTIPLTSIPPTFPAKDGVVRIGSECVKYKQIAGNELVNCQRAYQGGPGANAAGNGAAQDLEPGDAVMLEACYQIATRPFRLREGAWVRYTHVNQARTIGEMGVATLPADLFDRLRPYATAWNGNAVGDGWCNPQLVHNALSPADSNELYARVKNVRYFGPGTMVRITDGVNSDFAVVTKVRGTNEVLLAGKITHDYEADQARMYGLARSPINVNTADIDTLALVFDGLRLRGKTSVIATRQAEELAIFLKTWKRPASEATAETAAVAEGEAGIYRNWSDMTKGLEAARNAGKINQDGFEAVLLNAMNAGDSSLGFSTVPFVFRSFDTYEVRATVSIQGTSGRELARREIRRVMEVSTARSGTFVLETQEDFQNQIVKSRDAKWMATFPVNLATRYEGPNIPPSEYESFANQGLFPSTDRASGVGDVQSAPAAFRFGGTTNRKDPVRHFDEQRLPDGFDLAEKPFTMSVDGPYDPKNGTLDLIDIESVPGVAEDIELGMKEFACSFWYRPAWERDKSVHTIFDYGLETDFMDRVSLTFDPQRNALVLACCDATREKQAAEIVYTFDHTTWNADQWYHIAVAVQGCKASMMQLFIDGEQQGKPGTLTRLTTGIAATGDISSINVKDARDFPATGCLIIRGQDGIELMEYSNHTDNTFAITRRKARSIFHEPAAQETTQRGHVEGDVVELYGFAGPLFTDIRQGGAALESTIGPWRVYRFLYEGDMLLQTVQNVATPVCVGLGQPAPGAGAPAVNGCALADWDTGSTDPSIIDDLGPTGSQGIGMLVSQRRTLPSGNYTVEAPVAPMVGSGPTGGPYGATPTTPQSSEVGGTEFILFQVSQTPGAIDIIGRNLALKHAATAQGGGDSQSRFFPSHEFGEQPPNNGITYDGTNAIGALTAFIPIALIGNGSQTKYLNPQDDEPQLSSVHVPINETDDVPILGGQTASNVTLLRDRHAYVQVDGEWIAYDSVDTALLSGKVAFYRDMRVDEAASLIEGAGNIGFIPGAGTAPPAVVGGGSGGNSGDTPPAAAKAVNEETGTGPPEPSGGGSSQNTTQPAIANVPITSLMFCQQLDFRGYEKRSVNWERRIANTIPADHNAGVQIIPAFMVLSGSNVESTAVPNPGSGFAFPGFNDLITLRDRNGNDEQIRVQWGYMGWCAPTEPVQQTWTWDRPNDPVMGNLTLRVWDSRAFTRALKFPSGEMPDGQLTKQKPDFIFGKKYDNTGGTTPGTIDEIAFWQFTRADKQRPNYTRLGAVPPAIANPAAPAGGTGSGTGAPSVTKFDGIDDQTDEFDVHMTIHTEQGFNKGVPIDSRTYPTDGGVILIDDELILYSEFDPARGKFTECARGAFGTEPDFHNYDATVIPIHAFPASRLEAAIDTSSADYQLADTTDFPDDGYLRIGLNNEIIGYTAWEARNLTAPLGRIDPANDNTPRTGTVEKRVGGSIFRGRYGTTPAANVSGEIAIAMPFRLYDRYAERADDPEQSYLQLSWTKQQAIWKRVTWDTLPKTNVQVVALIRFSGGPAWDADKIIKVGQDQMPTDDRRKYLYEITDPAAINLLNVEADRIEVRLGIRYARGAYDRSLDIAPDNWKETPAIRKVVVEFVAPPQVLYQE